MVSGGFALLATTGALAAGLGGPAAAGAAVGAVTVGGVVTGLVPLVAAGALGILGKNSLLLYFCVKLIVISVCYQECPQRCVSALPSAPHQVVSAVSLPLTLTWELSPVLSPAQLNFFTGADLLCSAQRQTTTNISLLDQDTGGGIVIMFCVF